MRKLSFYLAAVWLALLPWHAFLKTWLSSLFLGSNADFLPLSSNVLSLWKEIILFLLVLLLAWLSRKYIRQIPYRNWIFISLIAYIVSILLFGGLQAANLSAFILGVRTDLLFVPTLLVGVMSALSFTHNEINKLLRVTLLSLTIAFGVFMCLWIIKPDIGLQFGYSPYESSYVESKPLPIYHCLFLQDTCIPRLQASFSGPNQAGSLAILWGGLLLYLTNNYWLLLLPFLALLLTFSRSALLGGVLASIVNLPKKSILLVCGIGLVGIIGTLLISPDIITHGLSSSEHWHKTVDGIQRIIANPFGTGLGSAGPVSRRLLGEQSALISENWYLQIGEEAGIVAFLLLLTFTGLLIAHLFRRKERLSKMMASVLLGVSFQALFLHLWEDSTVTMLIWFWIGISLCYNSTESTKHYGK